MKPVKVHYIHSLSYSARDRLAGIFVLVAMLMVLGLIISKVNSSKLFDSVVNYQAVMKNAQGISDETLINISGLDVGRVYDIYLGDNNEVNIHFFVYQRFQPLVRADSTGEISKLSLVGDNIIIIKAGSSGQPMLGENATIQIKEPDYLVLSEIIPAAKEMASLISRLAQVLDAIDPKVIQDSSQNLQTVLADLRQITGQIANGKGSVGRILYDEQHEQQIVNSLALIEKNLSGIAQRIDEAQPIIAHANQLAVQSIITVEEVAKLSVKSQQLIVDASRSVHKIDQLLIHLQPLIDSTQSVLQSTEHTLNGQQPVHVFIDNSIWPNASTPRHEDNKLLIEDTGLDE